jgi:hypothetical protein
MERLIVLYYIRSGYGRATAKTIIDAAQSVGAVARITSPRMPFLPYMPGRGTAATNAPYFGVGAVVICEIGPRSSYHSSIQSMLRPIAIPGSMGMKNRRDLALNSSVKAGAAVLTANSPLSDSQPTTGESEFVADPRMKELLSAAVANSIACQNWLSKTTPNLQRARVSIAHVIRDVNDLAGMLG